MKGGYEVQKARLVHLLSQASMTYDEMVEAVDLKKPTIAAWVKQMRAAGCIHISGYNPDKNGVIRVPLFRWAPGHADAPRPGPARTPAERMAALRADRKKNGGA